MSAPTDWWDRLYTEAAAPAPAPAAPPHQRLPDWRTGEGIELGKPEAPAEPDPEPEPAEAEEEQLLAEDEEEPDDQEDAEAEDWDEPEARSRRSPREMLSAHSTQRRRFAILVYNGTAAAAGWGIGLVPAIHTLIASCAQQTQSTTAGVILGVGICIAIGAAVDQRTRHAWAPLAWVCRIPLASAFLALGLYAPNS
ncbi:hypothetical protein ACEZCY_14100 [Streptacidiphilus sp. N1-12]|uniref:Major facilitator superfamily (MFS) profile domain-containing protein n=2 Tax=Streptacidiphilus alkalitolerans TaxID=3342712 RepID=A0ABV6WF45_9ACTN